MTPLHIASTLFFTTALIGAVASITHTLRNAR
jgi:hypothetical protein